MNRNSTPLTRSPLSQTLPHKGEGSRALRQTRSVPDKGHPLLTLFIQQVLNGLLDGVYYLLIALGLSLIFSLGGIVNLAHGAFYAIGAYLTIVLAPHIGFGGAIIASPVLVALIGIVIERGLFQRFYRADPILSLLLTFGLAMVAEQSLRMIFGAPPLSFRSRRRCAARSSSATSSIRATAPC